MSVSASDVSDTLDDAMDFTGLNQVKLKHKLRLLSDNGPCYISGDLVNYLQDNGMNHTRGRPYHLQTQGKIVRLLRSKTVVLIATGAIGEYQVYGNALKYFQCRCL